MGFRLVSKSVTLNDTERRIWPLSCVIYSVALFYIFIWTSHRHTIKSVKHSVQQKSRRYIK